MAKPDLFRPHQSGHAESPLCPSSGLRSAFRRSTRISVFVQGINAHYMKKLLVYSQFSASMTMFVFSVSVLSDIAEQLTTIHVKHCERGKRCLYEGSTPPGGFPHSWGRYDDDDDGNQVIFHGLGPHFTLFCMRTR
ncbi:hypothetical protein DITRI_Ditri20bG0052800 [Diplodiscus trichospermus]